MKNSLKRILLITPKFFTYENYIKQKLNQVGYRVDVIYENINEFSLLYKLQKIIFSKSNYYDDYYSKNLSSKVFDEVLVIRGSTLSGNIIKKIRKIMPSGKLYMYQWDSVKNNPNALEIAPYFDVVSTFDLEDAKQYGWKYRPLFYINSSERKSVRKYDIAYICTLHSQRVKLFQMLKDLDLRSYLYMYSKFSHYIKERYISKNKEFEGISLHDVKFKSLSLEHSLDVMANSNIVVDYTHPGQSGFTMRTCEAIGHRCKIVTNNKLIRKADFYNENNVYIYEIDNFHIPESFFNSPYIELPKEVFERYSISNWLKDIIQYE